MGEDDDEDDEDALQRLRGVIEAVPIGIAFVGLDGFIRSVNDELAAMLAYPSDELVGRSIEEVTIAGDYAEETPLLAKLGRGDAGYYRLRKRLSRRDGSVMYARVTRVLMRDPSGAPDYFLSMVEDITEQVLYEANFRRSQEWLEAVVENSGDIYVITDADGRITFTGGAVEEILGATTTELLGSSLAELAGADNRERLMSLLANATTAPAETPTCGVWMCRSDDEWRHLSLTVKPVAEGIMFTIRDTTDDQLVGAAARTLSAGNAALVRAPSEDVLLNSICHAITEQGGYKLAWVGIADPTRPLGVRVAAATRDPGSYLEQLERWAKDLSGPEGLYFPLGAALASREPHLVNDVTSLPPSLPWRRFALEMDCHSIIALPLFVEDEVFGGLAVLADRPRAFTDSAVQTLATLARDLAFGITMHRARAQRDDYRYRFENGLAELVRVLGATVELRDPYTAGHQRRVADLSVAIAEELQLGLVDTQGIQIAASIHDIGKVAVPTEILSKSGTLTPAERELVKTHSKVGHDIVALIDFPWPVATMILQHHERLDGSGYPQGLRRDELHLGSRIIGVADVVEAMSSHRPYRAARGVDVALEEIAAGRDTLYDPAVVEACLYLFREQGFQFGE